MTERPDDAQERAVVVLDLGTTNTVIARWAGDDAVIVNPGACCRLQQQPEETPLIPSCVLNLDARGREVLIGQQALDQDSTRRRVVRRFKPRLAEDGTAVVQRIGGREIRAREAARLFLREVFALYREIMGDDFRQVGGGRFIFRRSRTVFPRLVIAAPVDYFENYREELRRITIDLGFEEVDFIDEPLAAALGTALRADERQHAMVIDFGGGTCDVAVVELGAEAVQQGRSRAIAKCGEDLGGDLIDYWLMDEICSRAGAKLQQFEHIRGLLKDAAERVKIVLSGDESVTESVFDDRSGRTLRIELAQEDFVQMLSERGLFDSLGSIIERTLRQAKARGIGEEDLQSVLLVGGSTLIPSVREFVEDRFGPGRVLAGNPFTAVARGAAAFGAGARVADVLQHDYGAVVTRPVRPDAESYVPLPGDESRCIQVLLQQGQLCPTGEVSRRYDAGAMGGVQDAFHVSIYEIARNGSLSLVTDPETGMLEERREMRLRPLNVDDPTICELDPVAVGGPDDRGRIEITYRVDEARWLRISARDLRTHETLVEDRPVVQLQS